MMFGTVAISLFALVVVSDGANNVGSAATVAVFNREEDCQLNRDILLETINGGRHYSKMHAVCIWTDYAP